MQNSPTIFSAPPPQQPQLPLPPPPHVVGQINVLPAPPPPTIPQFPGAPSSVFQITVLPVPPPPPFTVDSSSANFSPLEFLLAIIAIVTIPALIYTFIFAFRCSSSSRSEHAAGDFSGDSSVQSELSSQDDIEAAAFPGGVVADVKYRKESTEIGGECPVCLSIFTDGEEVRQLSACKHAFHASCIDMWLSSHSNCPICRATIPSAVSAQESKRSNSNSSAENQNRGGDLRRQGHRDANVMV
ncbi:RING-H2 finger protein ATL33-like [Arachis stenosperma]|uniref:RING-H2 finger protein ATL33-like n=1 Tax=Arachis stenosperma TaxID=217475 RepID=UPI0025AB6465|nr:RING-H2 finger protein ATL33-like [Arachis stenosperma]